MIYESLIQYMNENSGIFPLLEKLKREFQRQVLKKPSAVIEEKIKKYTGEIDNLIHTLSHEELGAAFIRRVNERIRELDVEITSLKEERDLINDKNGDKEMSELRINKFSMELWNLKESSNILSMEDKRILIKLMVKKIVWDGKKLHVYMDR